jgi:hypothetical protein
MFHYVYINKFIGYRKDKKSVTHDNPVSGAPQFDKTPLTDVRHVVIFIFFPIYTLRHTYLCNCLLTYIHILGNY